MSRAPTLLFVVLMLTALMLPFAAPAEVFEADRASRSGETSMVVENEWRFEEGDFIEFDGQTFGEMMRGGMEAEDGFDRVVLNSVQPLRFSIMADTACNFNGIDEMCHVMAFSMGFNLTGYNDTEGWMVDMEMGNEEITLIHPDLNGWEGKEVVQETRMWMRDQATGSLLFSDEGWENETGTEQTLNPPTSITLGSNWTEEKHIVTSWTHTDSDGTESGNDETWENTTHEVTAMIQVDLPPNEADMAAGDVTLDALLIKVWDDEGEFDNMMAMSEYRSPVRMYMGETTDGPKIEITAWRIAAQAFSDSDGDGVGDEVDLCPDTAAGAAVDADGCAWEQRDDDGDGVMNPEDQCEGHDDSVDTDDDGIIDGCDDIIDSDGDGVDDESDQCPGADDTIDVDADGIIDCLDTLIDSDDDGVSDENDLCPGEDDTIDVDEDDLPDACDSLIDSDGDGVADAEDVCPGARDDLDIDEDGIADGCDDLIDSDGDGVADYDDGCHGHDDNVDVDADGIIDGCDPLIDTDGDGVADENDLCPDTPTHQVATFTGCSEGQIDTDDDGVMDDVDICRNLPGGVYDSNPTDGCPDDTDGDGLIDAEDACTFSAEGVTVDSTGCEVVDEAEAAGGITALGLPILVGLGAAVGLLLVVVLVMTFTGGRRR